MCAGFVMVLAKHFTAFMAVEWQEVYRTTTKDHVRILKEERQLKRLFSPSLLHAD
jgi:hypothetical protein